MGRARAKKERKPTCVGLVYDALRRADDFMTFGEIRRATGLTSSQVSVSLHDLERHRAAESVLGADGKHWFATPQLDVRVKVVIEIQAVIVRRRRPRLRKVEVPA